MPSCFVIQPFDAGQRYDKRYHDVFEPAIRDAGFEPYRVDHDPGVSVPIVDIEKGIEQSSVCFAEISTDNPNVWYELGYAIAKGREVVLLCSHERPTEFPFDVQHRNITTYSTDSPSDFEKVHAEITARLKAVRAQGTPQRVKAPDTSVTGVEELEQYEMAGLVAATLGFDATSGVSIQEFEKYMKRQNFNRLAATLACQALFDKEMLEKFEHEGFGDGLRATPKGGKVADFESGSTRAFNDQPVIRKAD